MADLESFDAPEVENTKKNEGVGGVVAAEEEELNRDGGELPNGELRSSGSEVVVEAKESKLETLAAVSSVALPEKDQCDGLKVNSTAQVIAESQSEEHGISHQEVQARVTAHNIEARTENHHQLACITSSPLSPTSVTQSISSATSPTLVEQRQSPPKENSICKMEEKNSADPKPLSSVHPAIKIPSSDGYNWRKYGQKQVKSPTGSRSYYKCTYSECLAKKIECCDHSGYVTEIVYKSQHTHDPPKKSNFTRETKILSAERVLGNSVTKQPCRTRNDSDPSTSSKDPIQETPPCSERKRKNSLNSNESGDIMVKEEQVIEPEPKRRIKKGQLEDSGSPLRTGKKPKFVVHAAGDVGISGDGYRWRKYGQKMVKGNPHPRNYYRCTSAGCPVRKHIETAVDNTSALVITYKGIHDHDMPVPKKRHGPPSAPLVAAAAPASMNNSQLQQSEAAQNKNSSTQWSVDNEGELTGEAMDLGGEKAMESARTLLSIGFEIKPC
ncbi:hypothetical protein UlMin_002733 [Ulmus minor]